MTRQEFIDAGEIEVEFLGNRYVLATKEPGGEDCPLATQEQFENGECPYAHIYVENGPHHDAVLRFGHWIGGLADLKPTGRKLEIKINPDAFEKSFNGFMGRDW